MGISTKFRPDNVLIVINEVSLYQSFSGNLESIVTFQGGMASRPLVPPVFAY